MEKSFIIHGVILSVAIHIFFLWYAQTSPSGPKASSSKSVVVDLIERDKKTIVTDSSHKSAEELTEKLKKQTEFFSKKTRRVRRQLLSRRKPGGALSKPSNLKAFLPKLDTRSDIRNPNIRSMGSLQENVVIGEGGSQDFIPTIAEGSFSALNTDQFLYYTYYARINEQLRSRWTQNVRNVVDNSDGNELLRISQKPRTTQVEVILDPNGRHIETIIQRSSGEMAVDQAVTKAFIQATPFIHPPSEMIQDDGFIHLYYAFHIQWNPRQLARGKR